jgi:hypothetical protein
MFLHFLALSFMFESKSRMDDNIKIKIILRPMPT